MIRFCWGGAENDDEVVIARNGFGGVGDWSNFEVVIFFEHIFGAWFGVAAVNNVIIGEGGAFRSVVDVGDIVAFFGELDALVIS